MTAQVTPIADLHKNDVGEIKRIIYLGRQGKSCRVHVYKVLWYTKLHVSVLWLPHRPDTLSGASHIQNTGLTTVRVQLGRGAAAY